MALHTSLLKVKEFHFSFVWVMEFSIISSCLGIVKVFTIILPSNLVDIQRLHEKGNFFMRFNGGLAIYVGCSFTNSANVGSTQNIKVHVS